MLSRGGSIVDKELEVDHFLRSMRMLRIALKTLFSRTEMFLIRNNRAFTLNSESSEQQPVPSRKNNFNTNDSLGIFYK